MDEGAVPSVSTIWRTLRREGLVVPQPQKKPRSCLIRFQAELPNEMWQTDITHWRLADGTDMEILNMIDDHSRHGTDWYVARDQLGIDGQALDRIQRLARQMSNSRLHTPSIEYELHDAAWKPSHDPLKLQRLPSPIDLARALGRHAPEHDDIERGR